MINSSFFRFLNRFAIKLCFKFVFFSLSILSIQTFAFLIFNSIGIHLKLNSELLTNNIFCRIRTIFSNRSLSADQSEVMKNQGQCFNMLATPTVTSFPLYLLGLFHKTPPNGFTLWLSEPIEIGLIFASKHWIGFTYPLLVPTRLSSLASIFYPKLMLIALGHCFSLPKMKASLNWLDFQLIGIW